MIPQKNALSQTDFAMDNYEIEYVLDKLEIPHQIVTYENVTQIHPQIPNWIIFFSYPAANMGHWACLLFYHSTKEMLFFDPYGFGPDQQWDYVENPLKYRKPEIILSKLVLPKLQNQGWKLNVNKYDIQGHFIIRKPNYISENMCGELVILRIVLRHLPMKKFYQYITQNFTSSQIYQIISILNDGHI